MGKSYDFYSPFVSAAILPRTGGRIPLWTNVLSSGQPSDTAKKFTDEQTKGLISFPFLESLTVEVNLSYLPRMTAVLTPPLRDAQKFLDSTLVEWGQAKLEAILGYSAGAPGGAVLSAPFEALILKPDISLGVDSTITLNAMGVAGYDADVTQSSAGFINETRRSIIEQVAFGVQGERELEVDFSEVASRSEADTLLNAKVNLNQGWKTDWMFILMVARDARCWIRMTSGNKIFVVPIAASLADPPRYTLRFVDFVDGRFGPAHTNFVPRRTGVGPDEMVGGDFPILSVSSPTMSVWLPGASKALVTQGIDSSTGETINKTVNDANAGPKANTGGGGLEPKPDGNNSGVDTKTGAGAAPSFQNVNTTNWEESAKTAFQNDFNRGINLRILTLGMPDILPGQTVAVRGVGARFDWNYGVFLVRHNIGSSGFTTELELVSNTTAILADVAEAQGGINDKETKPVGKTVEPTQEPVVAPAGVGAGRGAA